MSIYVVFIGGYHSSQSDMKAWKASAEAQRPDVTFDAYPYPDIGGSSDTAAVEGFKDKFAGVIKKIDGYGTERTLFIVGHSSGCAIANSLNSRIKGDHSGITVVDLDGFRARNDQLKGSSVQFWCAEGPRVESNIGKLVGDKKKIKRTVDSGLCTSEEWASGKPRSLNWDCDKQKYQASWATNIWSLHFSMVNITATDKINGNNYRTKGYEGCIANLCFLPAAKP